MKLAVFLLLAAGDFGILAVGLVNLCRLMTARLKALETSHLKTLVCRNGIVLLGAVLVSAIFASITHFTAHTPFITDADGKKMEGSVAELLPIEVNGHREWISIRGKSAENPVLLFLAGGPGGTQLAATRYELSELEDSFVVVNWEQPGSGKSYNAVKRSDITIDTYIEDGRAVTEYLRERFCQDKIYLMGESWGSALGIFMADRYPELYKGFIGTGQMVDFEETEKIDYKKALEIAEREGNTKLVQTLEKQGEPLYDEGNIALLSANYLNVLTNEMTRNPNITNGGFHTFRDMFAEEYGILDSIHFMLGVMNTFNEVYPQLYEIDLRESYRQIEIPVYFFPGRYDVNAPACLVEEYYEVLECPAKEIVWFEHSGHNVWMNESERFAAETRRVFGMEESGVQSKQQNAIFSSLDNCSTLTPLSLAYYISSSVHSYLYFPNSKYFSPIKDRINSLSDTTISNSALASLFSSC